MVTIRGLWIMQVITKALGGEFQGRAANVPLVWYCCKCTLSQYEAGQKNQEGSRSTISVSGRPGLNSDNLGRLDWEMWHQPRGRRVVGHLGVS